MSAEPPSAAKSKSELATEFGVSVKTLMRWLTSWNKRLVDAFAEPIDVSGQVFTPRDTRRIREQFS
ncbi:hypothetical protein GCM10023185_38220 [Hymenobacter saemangeumensis]|uniref:Helix-turn-helix domain-containing protein n=1 Tax=Hymenobacter saemangeumensis TaxID=1084522 RepID=A0ABP8IQX9_9BACT